MPEQKRVRFLSQTVEYLTENRLRAQVELEWRGTASSGTAEGTSGVDAEFAFAARATCRALESLVASPDIRFKYLKCEPVGAVGSTLAVAAVSVESGGTRQYTVGVCPLKDDPADAAVRAVLSATNRSMSLLL